MKYVDDVGREEVLVQQDVTRIIDLDISEQGSSVCQSDPAEKETVEPKRTVTTRTGAGGEKTSSGTITEKVPQRPPKFSPQDPLKRGFGDLEGAIEDDAIAEHLAEIPSRFRDRYSTVKAGNSRKAAIRVQCLECMGWNPKEVKTCTAPQCPLYKWRIKG